MSSLFSCENGEKVGAYTLRDFEESLGVNDPVLP